ncbi:MAG: MOSC domain-containing protein [Flavobacteriales bacterium]|nr:MOSC domain-containing protein [Flavobacteriales bacterium]
MNLHLASIHIHPVKSLGGFPVDRARLTDRGLEHDRRWMLVDAEGRFISQREIPAMACLHCKPTAKGFQVTDIRDGRHLDLPWALQSGSTMPASVWDEPVDVIPAPPVMAKWFAQQLGVSCTPVFMPDGTLRPTDTRYAQAVTSLSDGFPYLILSQTSLDDLNSRLGAHSQVSMDRFRPNLVIAGGTAFQEDDWRHILIGEYIFHLVKPCARCIITTTDQRTGARGKEPLATLSRYRRRASDAAKVDFGMNAVGSIDGVLRVGDAVKMYEEGS